MADPKNPSLDEFADISAAFEALEVTVAPILALVVPPAPPPPAEFRGLQVTEKIPPDLAKRVFGSLDATLPEGAPLAEIHVVREFLLAQLAAHWNSGVTCPVEGSNVAFTTAPLNTTHVLLLGWLAAHSGPTREWIEVGQRADDTGAAWVLRSKTLATLANWGLIESARAYRGKDPKAVGAGLWRPTQLGIDFLIHEARVPSRPIVFNATVWHYVLPWVAKDDVLPFSFDDIYSASVADSAVRFEAEFVRLDDEKERAKQERQEAAAAAKKRGRKKGASTPG